MMLIGAIGWDFPTKFGLWSPEYWLPGGKTWQDLPTNCSDVFVWPILFSFMILVTRFTFEALMEKTLDWSQRTYSRSLLISSLRSLTTLPITNRLRRKKMLENLWRLVAHMGIILYGLSVLISRSWLYDLRQCWIDYPNHSVDSTLWWYYNLQTAYYYSLLITCAFDVRRSDFVAIFIHHVATIGLLSMSWTINFVRIGTLVLVLHNVSDVVFEVMKYLKYSGRSPRMVNASFVVFLASWIATRLIYLPFVLLRSVIFDAPDYIQPGYSLFLHPFQSPVAPRLMIDLILVLQALHLFWSILIVKALCRTISNGELEDVRSDDEAEEEELVTSSGSHKGIGRKIENSYRARQGYQVFATSSTTDAGALTNSDGDKTRSGEDPGEGRICFCKCEGERRRKLQRMKVL
ncbi:TLC domain-containing protein [Ditylenchus destructor]|uniref:TLC domain-containing protein n=1 Tax=Ditylenchus destructor TaxID=166010 RepID=A0AAD4MQ55_9BILA|nr:TLC domain-containing protein [Ditylenchus destructor]